MRRIITLTLAVGALAFAALGMAPAAVAAPPPGNTTGSATITGSVGENVSTTDSYDGRYLRYVGNPAPAGFSPYYQWGSPAVLTESPEDAPVTMSGTIDVSGMSVSGQVAVIGLTDADALRAGDRGDKADDGIYVAYTGGQYTVGLTDGDAGGGEFVQNFVTFTPEQLTDGLLHVQLVVDGTADPASCASSPADVATADGCMTLTVNGHSLTDSYGTIAPTDIPIPTELGGGAYPGWYSAYPSGAGPEVGVSFNLTVSPVVVTADACKHGGYATFGFSNQGRCVSSVHAHK